MATAPFAIGAIPIGYELFFERFEGVITIVYL
jgi:hypothetical protein